MQLEVLRQPTRLDRTFGDLWLEQIHFCYTLEPPIRERPGEPVSAWKVTGHTAIPFGTFAVHLAWSPHFKAMMPHLGDVPGFQDVMLHFGDFIENTEGCTLVGRAKFGVQLVQSIEAFVPLWENIARELYRGGQVQITYRMAAESAPL